MDYVVSEHKLVSVILNSLMRAVVHNVVRHNVSVSGRLHRRMICLIYLTPVMEQVVVDKAVPRLKGIIASAVKEYSASAHLLNMVV